MFLRTSKRFLAARTRGPRGFASRGFPLSTVLFWLFLYCWLLVSRGSRRLPWYPVVSRPVVSRIVFVVLVTVGFLSPVDPVAPVSPPVVSRGLPY